MDKQVQFFGATKDSTFCQSLFGSYGTFEKTAGAPPFADWETGEQLRKFISGITAQQRKDNAYVLVNALGAGEYFGSNINSDYFPWNALTHEGDDYGYKTFLNAHAFQHHVNKDPNRAFGKPILSLLNTRMKRVELVIELNRPKAKSEGADGIITRIDAGEFPDVSMGCFKAGTLVTMSDGTRKPIEDIVIGDMVLTHRGNTKRVTELHRRQYKGEIFGIRPEGHPRIFCTYQHPFWAVPESQVKGSDYHSSLRWKIENALKPSWVDAEKVELDTYLLEPIFDEETIPPAFVTESFARLLGYYLAEGHILRNKSGEVCGIELTTNKDDAIHAEIERLCLDFGTKNKPNTFQRTNSEHALGISIFDRRLGELCLTHAGVYSRTKKLSIDVMKWPRALQGHLIGAYANGDGCGTSSGDLKFSTSSQDLAWQVSTLLTRRGIIPSVSVLEHGITGKSTVPTTEYVVHVGKQQAHKLASVCSKVKSSEVLKTKNSRVYAQDESGDGFVVTPVREISSLYAELEVYNLEVEDDNSYIVEGVAVHNCRVPFDVCSICGHKSKTRSDYCEHMSPPPELHGIYGPNKILPNGSRIYVVNTFPKFFDISFVFIGADKTAKVMAKLASKGNQVCLGDVCAIPRPSAEVFDLVDAYGVKIASEQSFSKTASASVPCEACMIIKEAFATKESEQKKVSEIIKEIPAGSFALRKLPELESHEPSISHETLDSLSVNPLKDILSGTIGMGMVLKPEEFQRIVLRKMGEDDLLDDLTSKNQVFREVEHQTPMVLPEGSLDLQESIHRVLPLLESLLGSRSAFGPSFKIRVVIAKPINNSLPTPSRVEHPLLDKISSAYVGYRRAALEKVAQVTQVLDSDPQLREKILGNGLVDMFSKNASSAQTLSTDSVAYLMGAYLSDRGLSNSKAVAEKFAAVNPQLLVEGHSAQGF